MNMTTWTGCVSLHKEEPFPGLMVHGLVPYSPRLALRVGDKVYSTHYSQAVTHPSTNWARRCSTSVIRRGTGVSMLCSCISSYSTIYCTIHNRNTTYLTFFGNKTVAIPVCGHCCTHTVLQYTNSPVEWFPSQILSSFIPLTISQCFIL